MKHPIDTLGQDIVLGNWYGTSVSYEGNAFVIMGQALKINPTGSITISIVRRRKPVSLPEGGVGYGDMKFGDWGFQKRTVSYNSEILFPIPSQVEAK